MSVVIVAIVIMAIAVPVIAGAGISEKTMENEADYRASFVDVSTGTTTISLVVDGTSLKVNGTKIGGTLSDTYADDSPFLITDSGILVFIRDGSTLQISAWYLTGSDKIIDTGLEISDEIPMKIVDGIFDNNMPINKIIIPDDEGDLGATASARVSPGGVCYWASLKMLDSFPAVVRSEGDPWNPSAITANAYEHDNRKSWTGAPSSVVTSDIGKTAMTVRGLIFDDPVLSVVSSSGLMFAPIEYIGTSSGTSGTVQTLIDMIPLLMIVGLMVATVATYIKFRGE